MGIIDKLIGPVADILDKVLPDADKKAEIAYELSTLASRHLQEELKLQSEIVKAEAQSAHFLTSTWRPILMLVITAVVAVHYLVFPIISSVFGIDLSIELPGELWTLLQIGVGGYVVGRSGEKIADRINS